MNLWKEILVSVVLLFVALVIAESDPCEDHNHVDIYYITWRNIHYARDSGAPRCDRYLDELWYRFYTDGDDSMPTYPISPGMCGTTFPIWIDGELPQNSSDGITNLTACVTGYLSNCSQTWIIQAKSCDTYNVYKLVHTPGCDMAYCIGLDPLPTIADAEDDAASDPCDAANYTAIDDPLWRNVHVERVSGSSRCDRYMEHRWYRFNMQDDFMPTFPVSPGMCGTTFPIWIQGSLPSSPTDGIKTVSVCTTTYTEQCQYSWDIQVKRCSGYHVYKLQPTPGCDMVYCIGVNIPSTYAPPTCNDSYTDSSLNGQLQGCQQKQDETEKDVTLWKTATFVCIALLAVAVIVIGGLIYYGLYKSRRAPGVPNSHYRLQEGSEANGHIRSKSSQVAAIDMHDPPTHRQTPTPQYEGPSYSRPNSSSGLIRSSHK